MSQTTAVAAPIKGPKVLIAHAVIVTSDIGGPYIGDPDAGEKNIDHNVDIAVKIVLSKSVDENPWVGFQIEVPIGVDNEDIGIGIRYEPDPQMQEKARVRIACFHKIKVSVKPTYHR